MDVERFFRRNAAYHEAGHAVTLNYGRFPQLTRKISIVPDNDRLGHTEVGFFDHPDWTPSPESLKNRVIVLLPGRTAERNLHGVNSGFNSGACGDLKMARKYVGNMASDEKERRSLMRSLAAGSKRLVETHWPVIEAVAEVLLVEMDGGRFEEIVQATETAQKPST